MDRNTVIGNWHRMSEEEFQLLRRDEIRQDLHEAFDAEVERRKKRIPLPQMTPKSTDTQDSFLQRIWHRLFPKDVRSTNSIEEFIIQSENESVLKREISILIGSADPVKRIQAVMTLRLLASSCNSRIGDQIVTELIETLLNDTRSEPAVVAALALVGMMNDKQCSSLCVRDKLIATFKDVRGNISTVGRDVGFAALYPLALNYDPYVADLEANDFKCNNFTLRRYAGNWVLNVKNKKLKPIVGTIVYLEALDNFLLVREYQELLDIALRSSAFADLSGDLKDAFDLKQYI